LPENIDVIAKNLAEDPLFWLSIAPVPIFAANLTWGAFELGFGLGGFHAGPNWLKLGGDALGLLTGKGYALGPPVLSVTTPVARLTQTLAVGQGLANSAVTQAAFTESVPAEVDRYGLPVDSDSFVNEHVDYMMNGGIGGSPLFSSPSAWSPYDLSALAPDPSTLPELMPSVDWKFESLGEISELANRLAQFPNIAAVAAPRPQQMPNLSGFWGTVTPHNVISYHFGGPDKSEIINGFQQPLPPQTPGISLGGAKFKAMQGNHIIVPGMQLTVGDVVGTDAAGPCIGCIVRERIGPESRIFAAHFDATENPIPTIYSYFGSNYLENHPGGRLPEVYLFGGNNSPTSNTTLRLTVDAFHQHSRIPVKYIDTSGLYIDQNGQLYRFNGDRPNENQGNVWQ
jgi:hypothetical protein